MIHVDGPAVGPVRNCEALRFQAAVGIRVLCGFPSTASVSTGLLFFLFAPFSFFVQIRSFPPRMFAQESARNNDRTINLAVACPRFRLVGLPSASRNRSSPVSDSPRPGERARDCKTESNFEDSSPPRAHVRSP